MGNKRQKRAAAEIFREQNQVVADEIRERFDQAPQLDDDIAPIPQAPPPPPNIALASKPVQPSPAPHRAAKAHPSGQTPHRREADDTMDSFKTSEELQLEKGPIQVRETGFWIWKRVIVPPNAYVVHTRIGQEKPVTLGLGVSFRYNPLTDAYLVVPAAMQTIGIISNCISQEKQGINVLAYVQWQISDFSIAYRKLDFSDRQEPLAIVNAQLREQADAAIKDKIATMSVSEVLTDKAPVIEELTRRLITVTEGRVQRDSDNAEDGLGIKIVTVQIKEALVSSQRLWEHLQAPFRNEQERNARLSHLDMQEEIRQRELETRQITQTSEAEARVNIERVKQSKQTEEIQIKLEEQEKRSELEQSMLATKLRLEREQAVEKAQSEAQTQRELRELQVQQAIQQAEEQRRVAEEKARLEQERLQHDIALKQAEHDYQLQLQQQREAIENVRIEAEMQQAKIRKLTQIELERLTLDVDRQRAEQEAAIARINREIENLTTSQTLLGRWIETMPELASSLPDVEEMRVLQVSDGDSDSMSKFVSQQLAMIRMLRDFLRESGDNETNIDQD